MSAVPLQNVPLFADIPEHSVFELDRASRVRSYPVGQVLWNEGDPGDALLILESGQIRICRFTAAGQEVVLGVLDPPAYLGELALIDGAPRDATVIAQRAVTVRLVPRTAFLALLESEPALQLSLVHALVQMVRTANARYTAIVGLDVPGRLAAWLLSRAGNQEIVSMAGRSQSELAAELSTTRSTLNRALRELEELGIVRSNGDSITILNRSALGEFTN